MILHMFKKSPHSYWSTWCGLSRNPERESTAYTKEFFECGYHPQCLKCLAELSKK